MSKIQEKAVIVKVTQGTWGARKTDKEASVRTANNELAELTSLAVVKNLIARTHLREITKLKSQLDAVHNMYTLPWLAGGYRILPSALYTDWRKAIRLIQDSYDIAVRNFLDAYPSIVQSEKQSLGNLYKEDDYPSVSRLQDRFQFTVQVMPVADSNDFRVKVNNEEMDEMKKELTAQIESSVQTSLKACWNRLYDSVKKISEKLHEESPKFRDSLIDNLKDLLKVLPLLNITGDEELEKMTTEIEKTFEDINAFGLRGESPRAQTARDKIKDETDDIIRRMEAYI